MCKSNFFVFFNEFQLMVLSWFLTEKFGNSEVPDLASDAINIVS